MKATQYRTGLILAACFSMTLMVGCNGGSSNVADPKPIPEVKKLSESNYAEAAAVGIVGFGRSQSVINSMVGSGFQLIVNQKPDGTYPCSKSGNIQLAKSGGDYIFTPVNCETGDITFISGSFVLNFDSNYAYKFNAVNYGIAGETATQSLSGELKSTQSNGVSTTAGSFTVERNKKADVYTNYKISAPSIGAGTPKVELTISTPRFSTALSLNLEVQEAAIVGKVEADDGSQVVITINKDDSAKIELKLSATGTVVATRSLSPAELKALIQKVSE